MCLTCVERAEKGFKRGFNDADATIGEKTRLCMLKCEIFLTAYEGVED